MKKAVYFDLDGVLCDWVARYNEVSSLPLSEFSALPREERRELKKTLFSYSFFRPMKPIAKGVELLEKYAADPEFDVFVLSATGDNNIEEVSRAKREWVEEVVGDLVKEVILVKKLKNKPSEKRAGYAEHILVDDRDEAVDAWEESGSPAIHFV